MGIFTAVLALKIGNSHSIYLPH